MSKFIQLNTIKTFIKLYKPHLSLTNEFSYLRVCSFKGSRDQGINSRRTRCVFLIVY